ncbi:MAG: hypothetical protein NW201_13710 [Gemmatimonadales bacterium]|nr:hypothetical protein [Gemmatimonadales bacterium]
MSASPTGRAAAQLAFLQALPTKLHRWKVAVEELGAQRLDESGVRQLARQLDETKAQAQQLGLTALAETAGYLGVLARRNGGLQSKVRGLRELLGSLATNAEGVARALARPTPGDAAGADGTPAAA